MPKYLDQSGVTALTKEYDNRYANIAGLEAKQDVISDLDSIRSGAAAGAAAAANDIEIVEYQDQTPITEAQLAKAVAGKLAIHCNGRLYAKYYQSNAIINFHAFDIGHNISSSVTVTSTMQSKEWVILLNRETRMLSNSGYMPVSAVGDYADNFLEGSDQVSETGKKLIREKDLYPVAQTAASAIQPEDIEEVPELDIRRLFRTEYAITTNVVHGSATGDSSIWTQETASVTFEPDEGYVVPEEVTITGATGSYNDSTGVVSLSNVTSAVSVTGECLFPKLEAPVATLNGNELSLTYANGTDKYEFYENDVKVCTHQVVIPTKGDLIQFDAFGDGVQKKFRVMKTDGINAMLLSMDDYALTQQSNTDRRSTLDDGTMCQQYIGNLLDTLLNTTYYNSLSSTVKNAILTTNRIESAYRAPNPVSDPDPTATLNIDRTDAVVYDARYRISQKTIGDRYCFALDIDDLVEYFELEVGATLDGNAIKELFFETDTLTSDQKVWLTSAGYGSAVDFYHTTSYGSLYADWYNNTCIARPAFNINLGAIDWDFVSQGE